MEKKPTGLRERSKMGLAREGREEEILSPGVHQSKRTKDEENGQFPMNDLHDFPHRWGDGRRNMGTAFFSFYGVEGHLIFFGCSTPCISALQSVPYTE